MFNLDEFDEKLVYSSYADNDNYPIFFKIVRNNLRNTDVLRFYDIQYVDNKYEINFNKLFIILNNDIKFSFSTLTQGYSESLGVYFDLNMGEIEVGCYDLCLNYGLDYSSTLQIFIKDKDNLLDYNVCFATEYDGNTKGFITGDGQNIESSTEWASQGTRSLKITRVGNSYIWTDVPIMDVFEGDSLFGELTIKNDCNMSIFFVFFDEKGNFYLQNRIKIQKSNIAQKIKINETVSKNIKKVHLRFCIDDDIGSSAYVDDIKIHNDKINIAIYGSCITKDPFTSLFNNDYKSKFCAKINDQRHSLISSLQPKENIDDSLFEINPPYVGSYFTTKCLIEDFNKKFIYSLLSETIDYIVMDIYFEIDDGILYYNDGKIITNAKGFENTPFYKTINNIRPLNMINDYDEFFKLWVEYCDKFFDFIDSYCPNIKIVLAEVRVLDYIERKDGTIYQEHNFSEKVQTYNPLIIKLEEYIIKNYDVDLISFSNDTLCADEHVWGKWPVHYHDKYYKNFLKAFNEIVKKDCSFE